ncbi:MAG TPA: hypothetical protein VFT99_09205 [Roseiflexaceae bacterium]|nr:hypothetical protein [Roseiflexaceae bacterium]
MTRTARQLEETRQRVYATRERDERIQAAERQAARRDMELMARLEWYGGDLEVAMAFNDVTLFKMSAALCRPQ